MEVWVYYATLILSIAIVGGISVGGTIFLRVDARRTFLRGRELDLLMTRHTQEIIERGDQRTQEMLERGERETREIIERGGRESRALMERMHADTQVLMRMILERTDRPRPPETA